MAEVYTLHAFGEHDLVNSTCGKARRGKEEMRNEEARAAGLQNVLNKYEHHSSLRVTISRTCEPAHVEVHTLHALGEHDLVDSTCGGKAKRGERIK